jgi:hypothetical protein
MVQEIAVWAVAACGAVLVGIGAYFAFLRPALLVEDERFIGVLRLALTDFAPGLPRWLNRVFRVLGGYISSVGILVVYLAATALRSGSAGALVVLALVWITSIGSMALINMSINSDFKWPLAGLASIWATALLIAAATG